MSNIEEKNSNSNTEQLGQEKAALLKTIAQKVEGTENTKKAILEALHKGISEVKIIELGFTKEEVNRALEQNTEETTPQAIPTNDSLKNEATVESIKTSIEETLDSNKKRHDDYLLQYRIKHAGLKNYDFSSMPQWGTFTYEQKMLVLEQVTQETVTTIEDTAKDRFQKKNKIVTSFNPLKWNPISLGKKIWRNTAKPYYLNQEEKEVAKDMEEGCIMPKEDTLKSLVDRMADMHLPVIEIDGKFVIEFEATKDVSPEHQRIVTKYNRVANEYARMSDVWKNKNASKHTRSLIQDNHEKYQKSKILYEKTRDALLEIKTKYYHAEGASVEESARKAMLEMKDNDLQISILQFTNTNPAALKQLQTLQESNSFKKIFKDSETLYRGLYIGAGWVARSAFATTLGSLTGPLVASIIGGVRARKKAIEKINGAFREGRTVETVQERKALGKKGVFDDKNAGKKGLLTNIMPGMTGVNAKEVAGFVDADSQMQRVTNLLSKIDTTTDPLKRVELINQLTARIDYIDQKKREGLINFGKENAIGLNYSFLKLLSEAEIKSQLFNKNNPLDLTQGQIETLYAQTDRRTNLTEYVANLNEAKREFEQSYFKNTETARGVVIGAGFAFLGWKIRDWMHGHINGVTELKGDTSEELQKLQPMTIADKIDTLPHQDTISPIDTLKAGVVPKLDTIATIKGQIFENMRTSEHGPGIDFKISLGRDGVPENLETVFNEISADHLNLPTDGIVNEEMAAKSLNMAANMVKLTEGHLVPGVDVDTFRNAVHFDINTGVLEIKDHVKFNEITTILKSRADDSWVKGILQADKSAVTQLSKITKTSWVDIMHAKGLLKTPEGVDTGIEGHPAVTLESIQDFK